MNMKLLMPILLVGIMVSAGLVMRGSDESDAVVTSGSCGANLTWSYDSDDKSLTISGTGTTLNDFATTSDNPWFNYTINKLVWDCPNLTRIGNNAFAGQAISDGGELPSNLTSIGNNAFMGNPVTYTRLPYKITFIGENAFKNCTSLALDKLPDKLTTIGNGAFEHCPQLKIMTVPYGVTSIGANVFKDCTGLSTFIIPSVITSIDDTAFAGTTNLTQVGNLSNVDIMGKFPNVTGTLAITDSGSHGLNRGLTWTWFEEGAVLYIDGRGTSFDNYTSTNPPWYSYRTLATALILNTPSCTGIGAYSFTGFREITHVALPDSITGIGGSAFSSCIKLTSIYLPDSLTSTRTFIFSGCSNLIDIRFSRNMSMIEESVFRNCTSLTHISIPQNITSIGANAFYGCTNLQTIDLPTTLTSISGSVFYECSNLELSELPSNITTIGSSAFYGCIKINLDSLPPHLTRINEATFRGCTNMSISELPDEITYIANYAFYNTNISISTLPSKLTYVGNYAFANCKSISSLIIPDSLSSTGGYVFNGCTNLISVSISQKFPATYSTYLNNIVHLTIRGADVPDTYSTSRATNLPQYLSRNTITDITFENVKYIAPNTFYNQPNALSRITNAQVFTDSDFKTPMTASELSAGTAGYVRYILTSGNAGTNLTYTIYKDGAIQYSGTGTTMTDWTATTLPYLTYTPTLTKVEFNTLNLENIGNYAVYNAENLANVTIPNTVETIGKYAFAGCSDLATIGLGNNLNLIDDYAFQGCESLALTELPSSLTLIHKGAFEDCSALALTKLPSGVTKLAMDSFKNCTSLTMTEIPETIHLVASGVFEGCTQMTDLTIYQSTKFNGDSGLRLNSVILKSSENASAYDTPEGNPWTTSQDIIQTVTLDGITHLYANTFAGMDNVYEVLAVDVPNQLGWYKAPNAQSSELADLVAGDEAWLMTYSSAEADINYDLPVINLDNADGMIVVNGVDVPLEPDMIVYPAIYSESGDNMLGAMIKFIPVVVILSVLGALAMRVRGKRFEL